MSPTQAHPPAAAVLSGLRGNSLPIVVGDPSIQLTKSRP
jgi:hypothetical protein